MNSFQKWWSTLTLISALTACSKPDNVEQESTSHTLVTQVQNNIWETLSPKTLPTKSAVKLPETIEIAGYKILAMPLESIKLTPEQEKKFIKAGGYIIDISKTWKDEAIRIAKENPLAMIEWQENFETLEIKSEGTIYTGFDLFKKIYRNFSNMIFMSKDQAIEAGLYPIIHYRNFAAREYIARMYGWHLATLDKDYKGELRDIYNAAPGNTNHEKLTSMGQAPLGWYDINNASVYLLDRWTMLSSDSVNNDGNLYSLNIYNNDIVVNNGQVWRNAGVSSIIILNQ